jgi:hypothetical protein
MAVERTTRRAATAHFPFFDGPTPKLEARAAPIAPGA